MHERLKKKIPLMLDEGVEAVPMESMGSIGNEWIPMEHIFSIREKLRKISLMLNEGVESRSDGVHPIHWKRIDSDGKVNFLSVQV